MPFPPIHHTLICELAKAEGSGKLSALGMFGIAPSVTIGVLDLTKPVDLTFVLFGGSGDGHHDMSFEIVGPNGQPVFQAPPAIGVDVPPTRATVSLVMKVNPTFPAVGQYTIRLLVDGAVHYEERFEIAQGPIIP